MILSSPLASCRRDRRAGRRVIDALFGAIEPRLERRRVFSEVVQKPGKPRRAADADRFAELLRQLRDSQQMLVQQLPVGAAGFTGRMCVVHVSLRIAPAPEKTLLERMR